MDNPNPPDVVLEGVREYCEHDDVTIGERENGRLCICATNEGGYNCTNVDLLDLINWLKANKPELLK